MSPIAIIAIGIVTALHTFFAYIEMAKWEEKGHRILPDADEEFLRRTKPMAANQGLYNLFLVVGLIWSVIAKDPALALCFLLFVVVAGVFGGMTISRKLFFVQALPAILAIATLYLVQP